MQQNILRPYIDIKFVQPMSQTEPKAPQWLRRVSRWTARKILQGCTAVIGMTLDSLRRSYLQYSDEMYRGKIVKTM